MLTEHTAPGGGEVSGPDQQSLAALALVEGAESRKRELSPHLGRDGIECNLWAE